MPKHRFTNYSKAQLNIDLIEKRKGYYLGKNKTDEDLEVLVNNVNKIKEYKRLGYLIPEKKLKSITRNIGFTK